MWTTTKEIRVGHGLREREVSIETRICQCQRKKRFRTGSNVCLARIEPQTLYISNILSVCCWEAFTLVKRRSWDFFTQPELKPVFLLILLALCFGRAPCFSWSTGALAFHPWRSTAADHERREGGLRGRTHAPHHCEDTPRRSEDSGSRPGENGPSSG